jgi:outer membrane lipoprotein carrier protein
LRTTRRTLLASLAGWLVSSHVAVAGAKDDPARRLAARVEDLYRDAETFKASFRQTFVHRASKDKSVSTGRMAAAEGGKLSFRYRKPKGDRVVSDGERIKVYERAEKRMYVMKLERAKHAFAVAFLLDSVRLTKDFHLRLIDPDRKKVKRGWVLEARPKRENPMVSRLILYVDPATAQVLRVMVIDAHGNTNRFDFDDRVFGVEIPDEEFEFKPPPGTKIIRP